MPSQNFSAAYVIPYSSLAEAGTSAKTKDFRLVKSTLADDRLHLHPHLLFSAFPKI